MANNRTRRAKHGLRITLTMESPTEDGMEWALAQAIKFAKERWYGVTVSHKDNPQIRASCRTTRLRGPVPVYHEVDND
jgi:hypothetical protein